MCDGKRGETTKAWFIQGGTGRREYAADWLRPDKESFEERDGNARPVLAQVSIKNGQGWFFFYFWGILQWYSRQRKSRLARMFSVTLVIGHFSPRFAVFSWSMKIKTTRLFWPECVTNHSHRNTHSPMALALGMRCRVGVWNMPSPILYLLTFQSHYLLFNLTRDLIDWFWQLSWSPKGALSSICSCFGKVVTLWFDRPTASQWKL